MRANPGAGSDSFRVVYVAGSGRSGSTLTGRLAAEDDAVVDVGEFRRLLIDPSGVSTELCGCGEHVRDCCFWGEVVDLAVGGWDRHLAGSEADRLRRVVRHRHLGRLRAGDPVSGISVRGLAEHVLRFYGAAAAVSRCDVVVDSSKWAPFAWLASHAADIRVLHLVRDPRAVVHSSRKRNVARPQDGRDMPVTGMARTVVEWTTMNVAVQRLGRRMPYARLRYEDLASSPVAALHRTLGDLGVDWRVDAPADGVWAFGVGHGLGGNRIRLTMPRGTVTLDDAWRRDMPAWERSLVRGLTSPLARTYGYA